MREQFESSPPLFEINGIPILDTKVIDSDQTVLCTALVRFNRPPEPTDLPFSEIIDRTGATALMKQKGWVDENLKMIVKIKLQRECTQVGLDEFRLDFTFKKEKPNQTN